MSKQVKENEEPIYDVVVIGGGPSGMMAAIAAATEGAEVILLEKNLNLGKKLLITGGGRCNVTNNKPEVREMLSQYKAEGKFLFSTFVQFGVKETVEWFSAHGVEFKEENEGRLFPETEKAQTIRDALSDEIKKLGVDVRCSAEVEGFKKEGDNFVIGLKNDDSVVAKSCVLATGGTARPETGSTGEGLLWMKRLGHKVFDNNPALVPVTLKDSWIKDLSGLTLPEIKISVYLDGKKQLSKAGKILFTHVGVTGPTVLNMSKDIGEMLSYGDVHLHLDLFPQYDPGEMKVFFRDLLTKESNKKTVNTLSEIVSASLAKVLLSELEVSSDTKTHSVSSKDRANILRSLKAFPLRVKGLLGSDKAVVSSGGVSLEEVDFRTMESKIVPNLFLVGDVLNINRPSGGYSLQLCWSTGAVSGKSAAKKADL